MYSSLEVHSSKVLPKYYHTAAKSRSHGLAEERRKETGPLGSGIQSGEPTLQPLNPLGGMREHVKDLPVYFTQL